MALVELSVEGGVARITLNRPEKRNALTREMINKLTELVEQAAADDTVRVLVLQANGKVFCAGMDLGEMQQRAGSPDAEQEWNEDSRVYADLLCQLFTLPFPTISACQGPALAGGVGIVLACDITIAAEASFFSLPEPARGITAAMVAPLLIHRCGFGLAKHLLLSMQRLSAQRAAEAGFCQQVTGADVTLAVDALVESILTGSPNALALTKQHVMSLSATDVCEQVRQSIAVSATARESNDAREGLQAFLEKRPPTWQNND